MTKTQATAAARITVAFHAWGIDILSVAQPMPKTAAKWFRVNVANIRDHAVAKVVAGTVAAQYGLTIVVVCW
jgi:hypothetical protein